ncbi:hypothetical protein [Shewanella dokdonensis]|uniref:hypothetical protein n=1 Tax=Shewanella dokdonensis TaxID=712036 RepID=UPI00200FFD55|nr:hypothetical protein [Shewanella dokdonensis]MCL1076492.1 hypothetical protein [Shewanella dokdonensis]
MLKRFHLKTVITFICLVILAALYIRYQKQCNLGIREALEWQHLNISLWLGCFICFAIHFLSSKDNDQSNYQGVIYKNFGVFADSAFAAITFGLASTTSAAILKGVYVQQFFGDVIYFNYFGTVDIYSMLVVCSFLFGYSIWGCVKVLYSAMLNSNAEKIEPVY